MHISSIRTRDAEGRDQGSVDPVIFNKERGRWRRKADPCYHGDGYIDIRQETIEQPQWRQLDDSLDRILKRFWPPPANPALREEARITPLAAQETRSADRGSQ